VLCATPRSPRSEAPERIPPCPHRILIIIIIIIIRSQVCVSDAVAAEAVSAYEVSISNLTPFFKSNPQLVRALEGLSVRTINQAAKAGSRSASILLDEVSGSVINVGSGVCGITVRPWTR